MSTSKVMSVTVTTNGVATKMSCTREVANMLMSKEIGTCNMDCMFL